LKNLFFHKKQVNNLTRSFKVVETGAIQKLVCSFLFAFHSNYGRICNRFRDI